MPLPKVESRAPIPLVSGNQVESLRILVDLLSERFKFRLIGLEVDRCRNLTLRSLAIVLPEQRFREKEMRLRVSGIDILRASEPFFGLAVILRVDKSKSEQPEEMWRPENKNGESLLIKGLKGYEQIDFEVDAKTANANVQAREMVDKNYSAGKH